MHLNLPQLSATVKVIVDVANQRERCDAEDDDRDPNRNGEEFAQDPKHNGRDNKKAEMSRYRLRRKPSVLLQIFDFHFGAHGRGATPPNNPSSGARGNVQHASAIGNPAPYT